ncbi:MAG: CotH kinase family protein [Flavobacteriales bacterium]|nr:CotH kinase family protein [Flavobacteriales bacterium]
MYKIRKGKWHPIVSDLDFTLGYNSILNPLENYVKKIREIGEIGILINGLMKHPEFKNELQKAYAQLEEIGLFSTDHLVEEMEALTNLIEPEMKFHIGRWGGLGSMEEWRSELTKMQDFHSARVKPFKEHFNQLINEID